MPTQAFRNRKGSKEGAIFIRKIKVVPLAGIEPALLAELDFESSASTNSATGARPRARWLYDRPGARKQVVDQENTASRFS